MQAGSQQAHCRGGLEQRVMMWVQPSAIAALKGTASNTAASTRRFPRCRMGRPATCVRPPLCHPHVYSCKSNLHHLVPTSPETKPLDPVLTT